jgi:ribonuclease Z
MGDTCSGEHIIPLSMNADMVIHEATNAWFREAGADQKFDTPQQLERDAFLHGHSTPQMAGRFARRVNARRLILTHFSPRYRGDDSDYSMKTMWQIENMARNASGLTGKNDVIAAWDQIAVPIRGRQEEDEYQRVEAEAEAAAAAAAVVLAAEESDDELNSSSAYNGLPLSTAPEDLFDDDYAVDTLSTVENPDNSRPNGDDELFKHLVE